MIRETKWFSPCFRARKHPWTRVLPGASALLLSVSSAFAQDVATAEALFNRGLAEMKAARYEQACPAITESHKLDPQPGTLFTLAVCEMQWGHVATAAAHFGDYISVYEQLTSDQKARQGKRIDEAKKRRDELAPQIPALTVVLDPDAPKDTIVKRNGVVLSGPALGLSLPVDPGEHILTTQVPGGPVSELRITLEAGEKKSVKLTVERATPPRIESTPLSNTTATTSNVPPSPAPRGPSGRRVAAYVIGGTGLAGLALGGVMGGLTLARKSVITKHCGNGIGQTAEEACDSTGFAAANSAQSTALGSTLGFGIGAAAVGVAVVLLVTDSASKPKQGMVRPFVDMGPTGAAAGVRGVF